MTSRDMAEKSDQPPSTEPGDEPPEPPPGPPEAKHASALIRERFGIGR